MHKQSSDTLKTSSVLHSTSTKKASLPARCMLGCMLHLDRQTHQHAAARLHLLDHMTTWKDCPNKTHLLSSSVMTDTSSCGHSTAQHSTAERHCGDHASQDPASLPYTVCTATYSVAVHTVFPDTHKPQCICNAKRPLKRATGTIHRVGTTEV